MPAAVRKGDLCTGHGCFPSRQNTQGSNNVFINKKPAHRRGDSWAGHCCGKPCHGSSLAEGSSSVFINGKPLARIGDPVACGSSCRGGSSNVFSG